MNTFCSEQELTKTLPITPRKLRKLRRSGMIPYLKVDRFTRLYDIDKVVAALEELETKVVNHRPATK
jgi:hypothetical protein